VGPSPNVFDRNENLGILEGITRAPLLHLGWDGGSGYVPTDFNCEWLSWLYLNNCLEELITFKARGVFICLRRILNILLNNPQQGVGHDRFCYEFSCTSIQCLFPILWISVGRNHNRGSNFWVHQAKVPD
jgi:hypothetical protein